MSLPLRRAVVLSRGVDERLEKSRDETVGVVLTRDFARAAGLAEQLKEAEDNLEGVKEKLGKSGEECDHDNDCQSEMCV